MDENETNQAAALAYQDAGQSAANAPLADAPQQQADADARVAAHDDAVYAAARESFRLPPVAPMPASSFAARIAAAKFEHREQGHDETMKLLDEMFAAIERLEARD